MFALSLFQVTLEMPFRFPQFRKILPTSSLPHQFSVLLLVLRLTRLYFRVQLVCARERTTDLFSCSHLVADRKSARENLVGSVQLRFVVEVCRFSPFSRGFQQCAVQFPSFRRNSHDSVRTRATSALNFLCGTTFSRPLDSQKSTISNSNEPRNRIALISLEDAKKQSGNFRTFHMRFRIYLYLNRFDLILRLDIAITTLNSTQVNWILIRRNVSSLVQNIFSV